jgi:hypothetical protein
VSFAFFLFRRLVIEQRLADPNVGTVA